MDTKNKTNTISIDGYISTFPPDVRKILQSVRKTIRQAAPAAQETIKYGIPTYTLHGNLVHFGGFAKHIGFYPTPDAIVHFAGELAPYPQAKGSIQFPLDKPVPLTLIKKIVIYRVHQSQNKNTQK